MIIFIKKGGFIAAGRLNALFRKSCGLFSAKKETPGSGSLSIV